MSKKKISVCIPCRNEVDNIEPITAEVTKIMGGFANYEYDIIFIDNCSDDGTREKIRKVCAEDTKHLKAILNAKNFPEGSGLHVLYQADGDGVITIPCDFQVPVNLITDMIKEWETGASVVALRKTSAKKDGLYVFRRLYYTMAKTLSEQNTLPGFTGSGMYDKKFIELCKKTKDPIMSIRKMVGSFAEPLVYIDYTEQPRRSGKTKNKATSLVDIAIKRFVKVSTVLPKYCILIGMSVGGLSLLLGLYVLIRKLISWNLYSAGIAPLAVGVFLIGAVQLILLGVISEYILQISTRQMNLPLVVEKERINFPDSKD